MTPSLRAGGCRRPSHAARRAYDDCEMESKAPMARGSGAVRSLLELDPELGRLLTPDRREAAEHELRVRLTSFPRGRWDGGRLADADPTHLGLLLADGVLAREVVLGDTV